MSPLEARDKIIGVATHRVRGGCIGLVAFYRMAACGARLTTVCCVIMGPAVSTRAFAWCRGRDGRDVGS
jgi:hypothetical protein